MQVGPISTCLSLVFFLLSSSFFFPPFFFTVLVLHGDLLDRILVPPLGQPDAHRCRLHYDRRGTLVKLAL